MLAQNKADGGSRRFITVEMDEAIGRHVTAKRIRKAIEGVPQEANATPGPTPTSILPRERGRTKEGAAMPQLKLEPLGGGFRFCKLGSAAVQAKT